MDCECVNLECPNHRRCICAEWDGRGWSVRGNPCGVHVPDGACIVCGASVYGHQECFGCMVKRERVEYEKALAATPAIVRRQLEYHKQMEKVNRDRLLVVSKQLKQANDEARLLGNRLAMLLNLWNDIWVEKTKPKYLHRFDWELYSSCNTRSDTEGGNAGVWKV